jgi:hypothetical protein
MRKLVVWLALMAITGLILGRSAQAQDDLAQLTWSNATSSIHEFPTVNRAAGLVGLDSGPLLYHTGGSIMPTVTTYAIFWVPPKLQTGGATSMSAQYITVQIKLLLDYVGHALGSNNTQYYQTISGTTYVQDKGGFGGFYIDSTAYPASGCTDSATPGNCISDAQSQAEISKVMTLKGWTPSINKMFLLFTSSGEGSCFTGTSQCAYTVYCAYHGSFGSTSTPTIYGNEPYGDTSVCQVAGTPSPNGNAAADTAATAASHELTEAITDPLLNAWFTAGGSEIGDLCAYNYGANTWDGALANQMWNGDFFELQTEYDNHAGGCVQVGP